jgi:hypothetical protein
VAVKTLLSGVAIVIQANKYIFFLKKEGVMTNVAMMMMKPENQIRALSTRFEPDDWAVENPYK